MTNTKPCLKLICEIDTDDFNGISGFDLGDMTLIGELGQCTSKGHTPDQSMMIFLSLPDILDGIRKILSSSGRKQYEFVGIDSSFMVLFTKESDGHVVVNCHKKKISRLTDKEFAISIWKGVQNFLLEKGRLLLKNDFAVEDLSSSVNQFEIFLHKYDVEPSVR
jgi:hypothetical protein